MKKLLLILGLLIAVIVVIILVRTFTTTSKQINVAAAPAVKVSDSAVSHLQQAIRFKTISQDNAPTDSIAFNSFHVFLQQSFPVLFKNATLEKINSFSLLFHLKGKNSNAPIILTGHQDVVPVEQASLNQWTVPPFDGILKDGFIWGRGAVDDKGSFMALLEAAEQLLQEGFQPLQDIYIALGHDEEASGQLGAQQIVALLKQRNIKPAFVLDEGGEITEHEIPGMSEPVALVGIAEKGYVTAVLSVDIPGGHSSMPAKETAIDVMSRAMDALKTSPFPPTLQFTDAFMDQLGPEMPFMQRMAFANRWIFQPLIINTYSSKNGANAMIRTTTAPTIFNAGMKENVIPTIATASVNFRTLPNTSVEDVVTHIKKVINDERIEITIRPNPSSVQAVADVKDASFTHIQKTIRAWRPDVKVAPYLVLGATDGRYYTALTPQVYRFIPFNDIKGFHGIDERVGVEEYKKGIAFYYWLIKGI
jgi:carboxypeptidase PM20D1